MLDRKDFVFFDRNGRPVSPDFGDGVFPLATPPQLFHEIVGSRSRVFVHSHTDAQGCHVYCEQ
jgi:hypothetical protein